MEVVLAQAGVYLFDSLDVPIDAHLPDELDADVAERSELGDEALRSSGGCDFVPVLRGPRQAILERVGHDKDVAGPAIAPVRAAAVAIEAAAVVDASIKAVVSVLDAEFHGTQ